MTEHNNRKPTMKQPGYIGLCLYGQSKKAVTLLQLLCISLLVNPAICHSQTSVSLQPLQSSPSGVRPVQGQISISREVSVVPGKEKISLNIREASLRDVLSMIAEQGHFNLIMDDSVTGTLTVDIRDISVNKALEYIFTVMGLSYTKDNNTIIVASNANADQKKLNAKTFKAIPVKYKNATTVATQLNETVFKSSRPGGTSVAIAAADANSNSLLIMGTSEDIALVNKALLELDTPRNRKVYNIRHNTPNYVAQVLAANFFTSDSDSSGGSSSGNSGSGSASSSGSSASTSGASATTGGASGSGGSATGVAETLNQFSAGGVTFIAEPIAATLTILGTPEQIALADSIIDQVDVKRPQAVIEVSLVEMQSSELKDFRPLWGPINLGKETSLNLNVLDSTGNPTGRNAFSYTSANIQSIAQKGLFSTFSLSQNHQSLKGKVLANPTIVALDGKTSTIDITDQIASVQQVITTTTTGNIITNSITTQDAGISLSVTPNITNDGSIILNLIPEVAQPSRTISAGATSTTLISKRNMNLSGVRVKDGETLVIGGLISESASSDISRIPGLDKMPIVSAMFRAVNSNNKNKTELVLMVTPHILKEDAVTYFSNHQNDPAGNSAISTTAQPGVSAVAFTANKEDTGTEEPENPQQNNPLTPLYRKGSVIPRIPQADLQAIQNRMPVLGKQDLILPELPVKAEIMKN
jgi:type II secretory pathway component GspD/PulD (secretin)